MDNTLTPEALARLRADVDEIGTTRSRFTAVRLDMVNDLRALLDAYTTSRADGVAAERACVVADLRAMAPTFKGVTLAYRDALEWAADRIEQGWHDKEGE
jgi:hypothetical protein